MNKPVDFTIRQIPSETHFLLKMRALQERRTMNEVIIELITMYVNTLGKEEGGK